MIIAMIYIYHLFVAVKEVSVHAHTPHLLKDEYKGTLILDYQ